MPSGEIFTASSHLFSLFLAVLVQKDNAAVESSSFGTAVLGEVSDPVRASRVSEVVLIRLVVRDRLVVHLLLLQESKDVF